MAAPQSIPQRFEAHVPLDRLTPHPANPNQGDLGLLCELVDANGFAGAVLAQESTGILIDGEHRWKAALEKGMTGLPVLWADVDDDTRDRLLASLNESARRGRNDEAALVALLTGLAQTPRGLEGAAFDGDDLDALMARLAGEQGMGGGTGDPDDVPEPPADPVSKPGDVWRIGEHRLLVGDCTDLSAVEAMLDGDRCDCMWTDPPYGVNYQNFATPEKAKAARRRTDGLRVSNDQSADLPELLAGALAVATAALKPGAAVYVAHPPGALFMTFATAFTTAGWLFRQNLVWVKDRLILGHNDYHYRHEPIMFGYTDGGDGRRGRGGDGWYGDNSQTSVFEIQRPARSEDHPTTKPAALVTAMLTNSCPLGGLVYDPFAGSGTTLIAAHGLGMRAAVAELDPRYADVILRRAEAYAGIKPERVLPDGTTEPVSFTQDQP